MPAGHHAIQTGEEKLTVLGVLEARVQRLARAGVHYLGARALEVEIFWKTVSSFVISLIWKIFHFFVHSSAIRSLAREREIARKEYDTKLSNSFLYLTEILPHKSSAYKSLAVADRQT